MDSTGHSVAAQMLTDSEHNSAWVMRFITLAPSGVALDLACGSGRHTQLLLSAGYEVIALDKSDHSFDLLKGQGAQTMQFDLEMAADLFRWPFLPKSFSAIVVTNYLHRPLFPYILNSLADDGILIYETFSVGNESFGRPSNPAFLLFPGELIMHMQSNPCVKMQIIAYEEGYVENPKPAMVQRICARRAGKSAEIDRL